MEEVISVELPLKVVREFVASGEHTADLVGVLQAGLEHYDEIVNRSDPFITEPAPSIPQVYISGPFTAPNIFLVETNVLRAVEAALCVARDGAMPVCPQLLVKMIHDQIPAELLYAGTIEQLHRCDAIVMLPGWSESIDAIREKHRAESIDMPLFELKGMAREHYAQLRLFVSALFEDANAGIADDPI